MKVYLLYAERGEYDDYQQWVTHVLVVSDAFDPDEDMLGFYHRLKIAHPEWFKADGHLRHRFAHKAQIAYEGDLHARFQEIPFVPIPYQLQ